MAVPIQLAKCTHGNFGLYNCPKCIQWQADYLEWLLIEERRLAECTTPYDDEQTQIDYPAYIETEAAK